MSDAVVVGALAALPPTLVALGGLWKAHQNGKVATETKDIATETRDMADGRLTAVTQQMEDLKVANARLIADAVSQATAGVLTTAQTAAVQLLAEARTEAATLLAGAQKRKR